MNKGTIPLYISLSLLLPRIKCHQDTFIRSYVGRHHHPLVHSPALQSPPRPLLYIVYNTDLPIVSQQTDRICTVVVVIIILHHNNNNNIPGKYLVEDEEEGEQEYSS